jgi:oxygen-independent coproporphyrinogen-3 oxidase
MCGIPGQNHASWTETLEKAVDSGAEHVSVYPLALEDGTPLDVAVGTGLAEAPDPDLTAELMLMADEFLTMEGFSRYEIANYARPGFESRHNTAYWTGRTYMGLGPAAHSMLDAPTAKLLYAEREEGAVRARIGNPRDLMAWADGTPPEIEWLDAREVAREDAMLGLRMSRGISDALVEEADVRAIVVGLQSDGLLEYDDGTWRLTRRGWLLGNEVFGAIWTT